MNVFFVGFEHACCESLLLFRQKKWLEMMLASKSSRFDSGRSKKKLVFVDVLSINEYMALLTSGGHPCSFPEMCLHERDKDHARDTGKSNLRRVERTSTVTHAAGGGGSLRG